MATNGKQPLQHFLEHYDRREVVEREYTWRDELRADLRRIWGGPLGWDADPYDERLILAKSILRTLLIVVPVWLIALFVATQQVGAGYPTSFAQRPDSAYAWNRPILEYPARNPILKSGTTYVTADALTQIDSLYAQFWAAWTTADQTGNLNALVPLSTARFYSQAGTLVSQDRKSNVIRKFLTIGTEQAPLTVFYSSPPTNPTFIDAGTINTVSCALTAADGSVTNVGFVGVAMRFVLSSQGWRIDGLGINIDPTVWDQASRLATPQPSTDW